MQFKCKVGLVVIKTFILMQFFVNSLFFSLGMINSSLGELGCPIQIISSLRISVHGSAYQPHHVRGSSTRYNPYPTPTHLITNSMGHFCRRFTIFRDTGILITFWLYLIEMFQIENKAMK